MRQKYMENEPRAKANEGPQRAPVAASDKMDAPAANPDFERGDNPQNPFGRPVVLNHGRTTPDLSRAISPGDIRRETPGMGRGFIKEEAQKGEAISATVTIHQGPDHGLYFLPPASASKGEYVVKCSRNAAGALVACQGADTLDDRESTKPLSPGQAIRLYSDGKSWWVV